MPAQLPVLHDDTIQTGLIPSLVASELSWWWESGRLDPTEDSYNNPHLPYKRPLTHLDLISGQTFLADLHEQNADGYGRWINLFGIDADATEQILSDAHRYEMLTAFLHEKGPLHIVVVQVGDSPWENIFVPHQLSKPIQKILGAWGMKGDAIRATYPYKRLHLAMLEDQFNLPHS